MIMGSDKGTLISKLTYESKGITAFILSKLLFSGIVTFMIPTFIASSTTKPSPNPPIA
jgi:hypothetical protein